MWLRCSRRLGKVKPHSAHEVAFAGPSSCCAIPWGDGESGREGDGVAASGGGGGGAV